MSGSNKSWPQADGQQQSGTASGSSRDRTRRTSTLQPITVTTAASRSRKQQSSYHPPRLQLSSVLHLFRLQLVWKLVACLVAKLLVPIQALPKNSSGPTGLAADGTPCRGRDSSSLIPILSLPLVRYGVNSVASLACLFATISFFRA